jgi:hypothetical protein
MTDRPTPFTFGFAALAAERFPAVADALNRAGASSADRDAFVLLEPVARLLRELMPEDAPPEALEAYVRLLHHVYRHWMAGGWVYAVGERVLARAAAGGPLGSHLGHQAVYLQLPEHRVWRTPAPGDVPEPLDGMFVTETAEPGAIAVLGIAGMHRARDGFSAVSVEGRADPGDPTGSELLVAVTRDDGSALFSPQLTGGREAGLYSLANAGELLILTCRLLAALPPPRREDGVGRSGSELTGEREGTAFRERIVPVDG